MGRIKNPERVRWRLKLAIIRQYGTEQAFAKVLGISLQQLSHIIMGRNKGWHVREKISKLLGKSEEWLFKLGGDAILKKEIYNTPNLIVRWFRSLFGGVRKMFQFITQG